MLRRSRKISLSNLDPQYNRNIPRSLANINITITTRMETFEPNSAAQMANDGSSSNTLSIFLTPSIQATAVRMS
jgi:hypothetical protein